MNDKLIEVSSLSQTADCVNKLKDEGKITLAFSESPEVKQCKAFFDGALYGLDANEIVDEEGAISVFCGEKRWAFLGAYYGELQSIYLDVEENSDMIESAAEFKAGKKVTLDFTNLATEVAANWFDYMCGLTFSLDGNVMKNRAHNFTFVPVKKVVEQEDICAFQEIESNKEKIKGLIDQDDYDQEEVKSLYERNIMLYKKIMLLSEEYLEFANFLLSKNCINEGIELLRDYLFIYLLHRAETPGLFRRTLIKYMEVIVATIGVDNVDDEIMPLIKLLESCGDESYTKRYKLKIYNENADALIQNKRSRNAVSVLKRMKATVSYDCGELDEQDIRLSKIHYARASQKLGLFWKAKIYAKQLVSKEIYTAFKQGEMLPMDQPIKPYTIEALRILAAITITKGRKNAIKKYESLLKLYLSEEVALSKVISYDAARYADFLSNRTKYRKKTKLAEQKRVVELYDIAIKYCNNDVNLLSTFWHNKGAAFYEMESFDSAKRCFMKAIETRNGYYDSVEDMYSANAEGLLKTQEYLVAILKKEKEAK